MNTEIKTNLTEVSAGDVFSESSHYILKGKVGDTYKFQHVESGQDVQLSSNYVQNLLSGADQYLKEVVVGKEDKFWTKKQADEVLLAIKQGGIVPPNVGDLKQAGIRSIFEGIHLAQVFTLCFQKQGKELSAKALKIAQEAQVAKAVEQIEQAAKSKKGVASKAKEVMAELQANPVLPYEPGEMRVLRGYKVQFESRDGKYNCVDLDLDTTKGSNVRPVNINSLQWIVYDGVKYILEA